MKFTASRLSDGNKIFPAQIHIEANGLTVKIPGLFRGKTEYIDFEKISNVSVNAPLIGYSTITFHAASTKVIAHGFKSSEVKQIKQAIETGKLNKGKNSQNSEPINNSTTIVNKGDSALTTGVKMYGKALDKILEDEEGKEKKLKIEEISSLNFESDPESIMNQLNKLVSLASAKPDKSVKNAILEKIDFGIMKLNSIGATTEAEYFQTKLDKLNKKSLF